MIRPGPRLPRHGFGMRARVERRALASGDVPPARLRGRLHGAVDDLQGLGDGGLDLRPDLLDDFEAQEPHQLVVGDPALLGLGDVEVEGARLDGQPQGVLGEDDLPEGLDRPVQLPGLGREGSVAAEDFLPDLGRGGLCDPLGILGRVALEDGAQPVRPTPVAHGAHEGIGRVGPRVGALRIRGERTEGGEEFEAEAERHGVIEM